MDKDKINNIRTMYNHNGLVNVDPYIKISIVGILGAIIVPKVFKISLLAGYVSISVFIIIAFLCWIYK